MILEIADIDLVYVELYLIIFFYKVKQQSWILRREHAGRRARSYNYCSAIEASMNSATTYRSTQIWTSWR